MPAVPHGERHGCRYTVGRGDTLAVIAKSVDVSPILVAKWNHLDNPDLIEVGTELYLTAECGHEAAKHEAVTPEDEGKGEDRVFPADHWGLLVISGVFARSSEGEEWRLAATCLDGQFSVELLAPNLKPDDEVELRFQWDGFSTSHAATVTEEGRAARIDEPEPLLRQIGSTTGTVVTLGTQTASFPLSGAHKGIAMVKRACPSF